MQIIGPPSASQFQVGVWLAGKASTNAFVRQMVPRLWDEAERAGVDPVGVICQSAKETGFGRFGGAVKPWMKNTCGLKITRPQDVPEGPDSQFAHATFATWTIGARAHVQHLLAYCGLPVTTDLVDPRFSLVSAAVTTWAELGGRWAPSPTYGVEVESMIAEARGN